MGWFGSSSPSQVTPVSEVPQEQPQQFLEDLPPKFDDKGAPGNKSIEANYAEALRKISLSDFTVERFVSMPCFREAMLTGFLAMGVLGTVTFLIHKNPRKALNWSVCGFFLGNIIGWEQCRSMRRRSFEVMEKARQVNREKNMKKWADKKSLDNDENLKKFNEFQDKLN